ncbi:TRAP transporter substrate-binding protein [Metapseudomonas otitidis]|uniref:TRAP transporter substrate-binding protein n=1 Tax=Metapseudomonas otitidis TaxID=319939 RepID=A0ABU3XMT6_9GAMM|nr:MULTISPECIES: TRAP transporter substrate-binding protein [Pseudomonas]MDL5596592.1 TRAP transporter substrate-binding protein [Bacillus subtilis]MDH0336534.1 TRAP transporter substrate-binding protein [Pseudomonas otitidis]MDH1109532.1 TRAP transporter substrate-binding protein [Pseudomonas otitidis]MDH1160659.1 TRAP transporter substrate-binding protein [Pseudomonas otitidis]MDH1167563.1 TRAP transporter substrate-binding protein [Pseudomonas otitidis]
MYRSLLGAVFASLFVFSNAVLADEPVLIKFSHVVAEDTPKGKGALLFKKLVEERLAGKVKVEVYPNSTLFGDANEIEALKKGEVQMLAPSLSKFEAYTKQLQVFDLPYLFDDLEAVKRFQKREKSRELLRSMSKDGIYGLGYWNNGMKVMTASRELHKPEDAKGLAFRIQPSSVLESQFAQLGATTVKMPFAEAFKALQAGTIQGTEGPWSNVATQKIDTVQPYVIETGHGSISYMLITNHKFWISIPYETRTELEAIVDEVTAQVNKEAEAMNEKDREKVIAAGKAKVITLTPEEREAWRQVMMPVWKKYEAEIGADVLRAAQTVNRKR